MWGPDQTVLLHGGRPVVGRLVGLLPLGTVGHAGAPGQAGGGGSGGGYTVYGTWS